MKGKTSSVHQTFQHCLVESKKSSSVHQTFQHCLVESKKSAFTLTCPIHNGALLTFL